MKDKKPLTIQDATKAELIEYFFSPISGGFRIGADRLKFLLWLENHRREKAFKSYSDVQDAASNCLEQHIKLIGKAKSETNSMERVDLLTEADRFYKRYEELMEQANKLYEAYERI